MALLRISDYDDLPVAVLETDLLEIARLAGSGSVDNFKLTIGDLLAYVAEQVGISPEDSTTHDVDTTTTPGVLTIDHVDGSIANVSLANMAEARVKGRAAGAGAGPPVDLTPSQLTAVLAALDTGAGILVIDRQEFTAAGADTWEKPTGAVLTLATLVGGGAGGGSGRLGAASSDRCGGGGGGAGGVTDVWLRAADLGTTETVTVGAAGTGGTAITGPTAANGNNGGPGGDTTFGSHAVARGGSLISLVGGAGGGTAIGTVCPGGPGTRVGDIAISGTAGEPSSSRGGLNALGAGGAGRLGTSWGVPGGGGAGSGFPAANNTETTGGAGGAAGFGGLAGGAGGAARTNGSQGTAPTLDHHTGAGGGGGGSSNSNTVNAGNGAAGRPRGGGGGGGGAGTSGSTGASGAGGAGGVGYAVIVTFCIRTS